MGCSRSVCVFFLESDCLNSTTPKRTKSKNHPKSKKPTAVTSKKSKSPKSKKPIPLKSKKPKMAKSTKPKAGALTVNHKKRPMPEFSDSGKGTIIGTLIT